MSLLSDLKKKAAKVVSKVKKAVAPPKKKAAPKPAPKPVVKRPAPTKVTPKKVGAKAAPQKQPSILDKVKSTAGQLGKYMQSNVKAKQTERNTGKFMKTSKKEAASSNATMDMLNLSTLAGAGIAGAKSGGKGFVNKAKGAVKGVTGLHKESTKNYLKYGTGKYSTAADVIAKNMTGKGLMDKSNQKNYSKYMKQGLALDILDPASAVFGAPIKAINGIKAASKGTKIGSITKAVAKGGKVAKAADKVKDTGTQLDFLGAAKKLSTSKKAPSKAAQELAVTSPGGYKPKPTGAKTPGKIPPQLPGRTTNYENIAARGKGYTPAGSKQIGNPVGLPTPNPKPTMNTPKRINMPQQAPQLPAVRPPQMPTTPRPGGLPMANPGAMDNIPTAPKPTPPGSGNYWANGNRQMQAGAGMFDEAAQYGKPRFTNDFGQAPVKPTINVPPMPQLKPPVNPGMVDNAARGIGSMPGAGATPGAGVAQTPPLNGAIPGVGAVDNLSPGAIDNGLGGLNIIGKEGGAAQEAARQGMPSWVKPAAKWTAGLGAAGLGGAYLLGGDPVEQPQEPNAALANSTSGGGRSGGRSGGSGGSGGGYGGGMGGGGAAANTGMPALDAAPVDQAGYMEQVAGIMDQFLNNDPVMKQMLGQLPNGGAIGNDLINNPVNPADPNAPQKPTDGYQPPNMNWPGMGDAVNSGGMTLEQATGEINKQLQPQYTQGTEQIKQSFAQRKQALQQDLAARGMLNSGAAAQLEAELMKMEADSLAAFTAEHNGKVLDYAMQNMQLDQQKTEQLQQLYLSQKQMALDSYFKQMDYSLNLQQLSQQQQSMYMDYYQNMKMYAFQTMMDMVKKSMPDYNYYVSQKTSGGNYNFNYN